MRIIVIDDERPALELMVETVEKLCPNDEVVPFREARDVLEYIKSEEIDVAFLDIELGKISGIELAINIKKYSPRCNIIFVTSYSKYGTESFRARPSGYLTKPYTEDEIRRELDNLRYPILEQDEVEEKTDIKGIGEKKLKCTTFGNFIVYKENGEVMTFSRTKSKELLAYLIDCIGFPITSNEIAHDLYEVSLDKQMSKNISKVIIGLMDDLKKEGYEGVVIKQNRQLYINKDRISCDIYDAINGDVKALNSFRGDYMIEYSWAEISDTVAKIKDMKN